LTEEIGRGPVAPRYDAVLLDLDGVVYRGNQVVAAAPQTLEGIRALGVRVLFLTNNSSRTPDEVASKLNGLGVTAKPQEVLTSALATAAMLRGEGFAGKTAFVIGETGIKQALREAGIQLVDGFPERADLVVVGWSGSVDYSMLRTAALLVERGARLVATNADASFPAPDGLWPGAGAILAAVTTTTGAAPTVVGKPARPLFRAAAASAGSTRPLIVGDRPDTDISGAIAMGWDSLLVLTGATGRRDLLRARALPTYLGADLSAVLRDLPPARFRHATSREAGHVQRLLGSAGLSSNHVVDLLDSTLVSRAGPSRTGVGPGGRASEETSPDDDAPQVDGDTSPPDELDMPHADELDTLPGSQLDATACLQTIDGFGVLRAVAVRPSLRNTGLGTLAVAAAVMEARTAGLADIFLFTTTAAGFFESLGFRSIPRSDLPGAVEASDHARSECAHSATPMVIHL